MKIKDPTLHFIVKFSEGDEPFNCQITLIVGGLLVSGTVISHAEYMQHNPITQNVQKGIETALAESSEAVEPDDGLRSFIHLKDAQYFVPGQVPCPTNEGLVCRIYLKDVAGFHFGKLSTTPKM